MPEVHTTQAADLDLDGIWYYIACDNPDAAGELLRRFRTRCLSYAHQPALGESRTELGRDVRCFSLGSYVVYYQPVADGIEVLRVIHGARDIRRL